ncbi:MAG: hypothetical protein DDG60_14595 [Anaerolineae bacterium]|nr:MAG: hypothetical protein DDG60_14595 [Anaerolineae bacterium]
MSDYYGRVSADQDPLTKLISYIPGFNGYIEREKRRAADKLVRDTVARRFEELYKRLSALQTELINQGNLEFVDDMEKAAVLMRTFTDKIRNATYGYAGFFDAVKINEQELAQLYAFDNAFFELGEQINAALDTIERSLGDVEALPAAIRHLASLNREAVTTFDRRYEVVSGAK